MSKCSEKMVPSSHCRVTASDRDSKVDSIKCLQKQLPELPVDTIEDMLAAVDWNVDALLKSFLKESLSSHTLAEIPTSGSCENSQSSSKWVPRLEAKPFVPGALVHAVSDNISLVHQNAEQKKQAAPEPNSRTSVEDKSLPTPVAETAATESAQTDTCSELCVTRKESYQEDAFPGYCEEDEDLLNEIVLEVDPTSDFVHTLFEQYSNPLGDSFDVNNLLLEDFRLFISASLAFELYRNLATNLSQNPAHCIDSELINSHEEDQQVLYKLQLNRNFVWTVFALYSNPLGYYDIKKIPRCDLEISVTPDIAFEIYEYIRDNLVQNIKYFVDDPVSNKSQSEVDMSAQNLKLPETTGYDPVKTSTFPGNISECPVDGFSASHSHESLCSVLNRLSNASECTAFSEHTTVPNLRAIMNDEARLQEEEDSKMKKFHKEFQESIAMRLSLRQLTATFPTLSQDLIVQHYVRLGCNYKEVIRFIQHTYPQTYKLNVDENKNKVGVSNEPSVLTVCGKATDIQVPRKTEDLNLQEIQQGCDYHRQKARYYALKFIESSGSKGAVYYQQQFTFHQKEKLFYEKQRGELIFAQHNRLAAGKLSNCIDLHHLRVHEAMNKLELFVKSKEKSVQNSGNASGEIRIVCGHGNHSDFRGPKLMPHVISYLQKRRYPYVQHTGFLVATIVNRKKYPG